MKEVVDKRSARRYSMVAPSGMNVPVIRSVITTPRPVIELPFLIAKALFRVHMLNRLIAEGNSPNEAIGILNSYTDDHVAEMIAKIQAEAAL